MSDKQEAAPSGRKAEIEALEERVRIGELRAREVEAEVRLVKALAERRNMKATKKAKVKAGRKARRKSTSSEKQA